MQKRTRGRPSEPSKHNALLALLAAAEAHGRLMPDGSHVCDPALAAEYAVEVVGQYLEEKGRTTANVRTVVAALMNSSLAHARGTAPQIANVVRPSQMAVTAALPALGIEPPTNFRSLDVLIRRLIAKGYEPVTGWLTVLAVMRS